jgi:hypothetical protein
LAFFENSDTLLCTGFEKLVSSDLLRMRSFFLEALGDSTRSDKVESLRKEPRSAIEELKRNKDLLERRLLAQLKEIQKKRSELDVWGKNAKKAMIREDLQCSRDIGEGLEIIVSKDPREAEVEKTLPDVYSDSLDSEEEFLDAAQ